ncbi:MAG: DUF1800 domain-containing protein [Ardenticatenaceae bacterium]
MTDSNNSPPPADHGARPLFDRRTLLKGAGVAGAIAATARADAQTSTQKPVRYMRTPESRQREQVTLGELPALPPLEVIALNRMGFGPLPGELEAFRALGDSDEARLQGYVEQQLNPQAIDDSEFETRLTALGLTTLTKTRAQLWADHVTANPEWSVRIQPVRETTQAAFLRGVYSRRQLVEVLADFWHNHFSVYGWGYWIGPVFVDYDRDVIRAHMFGNFREMLEAVATHPAMLYYLDNHSSSDGGPNENYTRELFELHTLGAEHYLGVMAQKEVPTDENGLPIGYVDNDIYEATRCFTGWRVASGDDTSNDGSFYYREDWHDRFQKLVLGQFIPNDQEAMKDGRDVLDLLAAHPGTGRHIARKLCRRFISDTPPERIVEEAAAVFTANVNASDQLTQVVRTILLSPEFSSTWGEKIKRPFELFCSVLRATDATYTPTDSMWWYDQTGHELFSWPAPNGYPDFKEDWSSTMPMLQRWRMINRIINGVDGIQLDILNRSPSSGSANELTDLWTNHILGRPMSEANRTEIVYFMADGRGGDIPFDLTDEEHSERLRHMVGLILLSPDFQWR